MDAAVRVFVRAFDSTMYASVGFLLRHPHTVVVTASAAGLAGLAVFGVGLARTLKARGGAR